MKILKSVKNFSVTFRRMQRTRANENAWQRAQSQNTTKWSWLTSSLLTVTPKSVWIFMPTQAVATHCLLQAVVTLVTRTQGLKVILLKDIGNEGASVCSQEKNKEEQQCNAGQGKAVWCRAMKQKSRAVKENITSGQSGDCLVYLGLLIYSTYGSVHRLWFVHCTSLIIDGIIAYCPIGWHALWESVKQLWESSKMSGPILECNLSTVGDPVSNQEWAKDSFLIRAWVECISPTPYMDISFIHIWLHLMVSTLLIGWYPYSHWVNGCMPRRLGSYRVPPFGAPSLGFWEYGELPLWLLRFITWATTQSQSTIISYSTCLHLYCMFHIWCFWFLQPVERVPCIQQAAWSDRCRFAVWKNAGG